MIRLREGERESRREGEKGGRGRTSVGTKNRYNRDKYIVTDTIGEKGGMRKRKERERIRERERERERERGERGREIERGRKSARNRGENGRWKEI